MRVAHVCQVNGLRARDEQNRLFCSICGHHVEEKPAESAKKVPMP